MIKKNMQSTFQIARVKKIVALSLLSLACILSPTVNADSGFVKFSGEIIDASCNITNSSSDPLNVNLGKVTQSSFNGIGSTAAPTRFTLQLTNCPVVINSAAIKFDGIAANGDNSILALTQETGVATGVGIQLYDDTNTIVPLFTASKKYSLQANTTNNLDFLARYIATSTLVTSGPANSVANFTVIYN